MGWLSVRVPPMNGDVAHWRSISLNQAGPEQSGAGLLHLKMPDGTWVQHVAPDTAGSHRLRLNTWADWETALFMGTKGVLWRNTAEGGTPGELVTVDNSGGASGDAFSFADRVTYSADGYQGKGFLLPPESPHHAATLSWIEPTQRNFPDLYVRFYMKADVKSGGYFEDFCWAIFGGGSSSDPANMSYFTTNMIMAVWESPTSWQLWFDNGLAGNDPNKYWDFSIPTGQWIRIELHFGGGNREIGPLEARVFLDPAAITPTAEKGYDADWTFTSNGSSHPNSMCGISFGRWGGWNVFDNVVMDGLAVSNTGWIGP